MKKGKFLLINALVFGTFIGSGLTSCSNTTTNESAYEATVTFDYDSSLLSVGIKDAKESYKEGNVIALNLTFNSGYDLSFVTLNGETVEDINSITLAAGKNIIKIYVKTTGGLTGSTNIRDFIFEEDGDGYAITSYVPTGIIPTTVDIPETYQGKKVTTIKTNAFVSAGGIKYVNISKNITTIEKEAFKNLSTLVGFEVSSENSAYSSIDGNLYSKDQSIFYVFAAANTNPVKLPSALKTISDSAFYGATKLKSVTLNDGLETIGDSAFYNCQSLESIVIPNTVTTIGASAFKGCSAIKSVTLSNSLTALNDYTFMQCLKLQSIDIPSSVKTIGTDAFFSCYELSTITFHEGLVELKDSSLSYSGIIEVTFPSTLKTVGENTFTGCDYLTSVKFNEGLETIGSYAFNITKLLSYVNIPSTVTSIGKGAFTACLSLKEFDVSSSNKNYAVIDGVLFTKDLKTLIAYPNSKADKSYTIPTGTETIDFRAFNYISSDPYSESNQYYSLEELTIPTSVVSMKNPFFGGKLKKVTYLGTIAEFNEHFSDTIIDSGSEYKWNDGAKILSVVCNDGTWSA